MTRKFVAGNWKMNGSLSSITLINDIAPIAEKYAQTVDIAVYVPALYIYPFVNLNKLTIGAQNCHVNESGAHTGEISAKMISDAGVKTVIVGHSERRIDCFESNEIVHQKAQIALDHKLKPIICIGETKEQYEQGISQSVIIDQLRQSVPQNDGNIAIGYEPVWAIGTGLIPELAEIEAMHTVIRKTLSDLFGEAIAEKIQILYGGSVKPSNANEIAKLKNVDGALVGGASLNADDFGAIIEAFGS